MDDRHYRIRGYSRSDPVLSQQQHGLIYRKKQTRKKKQKSVFDLLKWDNELTY